MAKVYHYRTRDRFPVCWREDERGRLRRLTPHDLPVSHERVAVEVLADALGRRGAWALADRFEAWLSDLGEHWDLTDADIRAWAETRTDGPAAAGS